MTGVVEAGLLAIFGEFAGSAIVAEVIVVAASVYVQQDMARRQQNAAKDAYNASLRDRYTMVRGATEPRHLVLGRQRVSGTMFYVGSYGAAHEHLVFTMAIAGHEIDGFEAIYFDDEQVTIDGSGNVLGVNRRDVYSISAAGGTFALTSNPKTGTVTAVAKYGTTSVTLGVSVAGSNVTVSGAIAGQTGVLTISYLPDPSPYNPLPTVNGSDSVVLNGSGNGSVTLAHPPIAGTVRVTNGVGGVDFVDLTPYTTVVGSLVTVTGAPYASATAPVAYSWTDTTTRARVRMYTGAPGQAADAGMIAALPGVWTSAHKATGVAYLVVELDFDPNAFPTGLPNVSALVRGAKVLDTRTGITAWSENPALLMRHAATNILCGRLATSLVNDTAISVAATICDTPSGYVVNGRTFLRPLYTAGLVARSGTRPADVLNDLAQAMAGKWVFVDGQLRVKAGTYSTPLQTLDESWLHDSQAVQVTPRSNRADVYNTVTGKFADEQTDYQILDYPPVQSAPYLAEDGLMLPLDVQLNAVTFVGQAQQIVAAMMRDARQGMRVSLVCNMRAYPVEVFDVIYVSLSRFGWVSKPFEVYSTSFTVEGGIQLGLKETDPTAWALGTSFSDTDPAPNTLLPSPFQVQDIAGLACASGSAQQADGTFQTRIVASWTAQTDPGVINGGGVEVRYGAPSINESLWTTVTVLGAQAQALLPGVNAGQLYLVKARGFNTLAKGKWCLPVLHQVAASGRIDTGQLLPNAATEIRADVLGSAAGGFYNVNNTIVDSDTFTPAYSCTAIVTISWDGLSAVLWDGLHGATVRCIDVAASTSVDSPVQSMNTVRSSYSTRHSFSLTAGRSYQVGLNSVNNPSTGAGTGNQFWNVRIHTELIKR